MAHPSFSLFLYIYANFYGVYKLLYVLHVYLFSDICNGYFYGGRGELSPAGWVNVSPVTLYPCISR